MHIDCAIITPLTDRIVEIFIREDILVDREDMLELYRTVYKHTAGKQYHIMFVAPKYSSFTRDALDVIDPKATSVYTKTEAIVLQSVAMKLTAKFHYRDKQIPYVSQAFDTSLAAMNWLRERVKEEEFLQITPQ